MSDPTATLGDMSMALGSTTSSGASFELENPPWRDAHVTVDGWEVEVRKGAKLVVARGGAEQDYEAAYRTGLMRAQQGLDLLSARGLGDLAIKGFDDEHVVWWVEPELVVRVVSLATLSIRIGPVELKVTDADGIDVPPTPAPQPVWHESFRYFRLSQTSDDLFDAYRNAYLALESILSDICPQTLKANGRPDEGEGQWFGRALTAADAVAPLADFVPAGTADPHTHLFNELFRDMRSAMSHAKSGRKVLLPRSEAERAQVTASLQRLVSLYLKLADNHLGMRRLGGGMTAVAFQSGNERMLQDMSVYASDEESAHDPAEVALNPSGGRLVELQAAGPVISDEPFLCTRLFTAPTQHLTGLPFIRLVGATDSQGQALLTATLEGRLHLGPAGRFEALLGVRGVNAGQPRRRYSF